MAGWQTAVLKEIPPVRPDWPKTWKSVRHHFGIEGFGINAVSKDADQVLIPEHDETPTGQQEVYFVHEGEAIATVDGEEVRLRAGELIEIEPAAKRTLRSAVSPTTVLLVGGAPGKPYEVGEWEK